jgi:hypothetical protein
MQQYTPGDFLSLVSDLVPIYVPQIHRYRWSESEHPRFEAGRPEGGQFKATGQVAHSVVHQNSQASQVARASSPGGQFRSTRRREIVALPDTVQRGHALHLTVLDQNTKLNLQGWASKLSQLMSPVDQVKTEQDKEYAWSQVNKNEVRSLLNEMNQWDRAHGKATGRQLSDFVNANGLIPRFLAERLDSGSRFFDPEKIRDKLSAENRGTPEFSEDEESAYRQFQNSERFERKKMLENPGFRSVVERKMGLVPSRPESATTPESLQKTTEQGFGPSSVSTAVEKKTKRTSDLSPQLASRARKAIEGFIGDDNFEAQTALEKAVPEAWRTMKQEVEEWNDGLRGIFGAVSAKNKALGSMIQKVGRADDPMSIVGFDEYVDFARKKYPHIVANKWGEEEGLMEAFRTGIKPIPKVDSDEVIERAIDMLGPSFRKMLEEGTPQDNSHVHSKPVFADGDPIPFSVRAWMNWMNRPQKFTR